MAFRSAVCSFIVCCSIKKFSDRDQEIVMGKAPAATSIIGYNQRGPSVLSYVSQFAKPPAEYGLESLAHRAVHSILRLPPNTFSRTLTDSIACCSEVNPLPIRSYCSAVRYRFAVSEVPLSDSAAGSFFSSIGDNTPLLGLANSIPHGGMNSPSILESLHDTPSLS